MHAYMRCRLSLILHMHRPKSPCLGLVAYCSGGDGIPRFVIGGSAFVGEEEKTFFTQ